MLRKLGILLCVMLVISGCIKKESSQTKANISQMVPEQEALQQLTKKLKKKRWKLFSKKHRRQPVFHTKKANQKIIVVPDTHGNYPGFLRFLFNAKIIKEPAAEHSSRALELNTPYINDTLLIFLGDILDRGPGEFRILNKMYYLKEVSKKHRNINLDVVFILGNHEISTLRLFRAGNNPHSENAKKTGVSFAARRAAFSINSPIRKWLASWSIGIFVKNPHTPEYVHFSHAGLQVFPPKREGEDELRIDGPREFEAANRAMQNGIKEAIDLTYSDHIDLQRAERATSHRDWEGFNGPAASIPELENKSIGHCEKRWDDRSLAIKNNFNVIATISAHNPQISTIDQEEGPSFHHGVQMINCHELAVFFTDIGISDGIRAGSEPYLPAIFQYLKFSPMLTPHIMAARPVLMNNPQQA